ncbi:MAG TPA: TetR family transcriptional regulator [Beutenbergiaceae bacterium]|nr:TetR family transcriptional regulator [Beutenbergiaceae bacterium]
MARASRAESERTGARIRATAQAMFAAHGYTAVGLAEVAQRAQVTRGAIYHHYASKAGLFAAVHEAAQSAVARQIADAVRGIEDPWESLRVGSRAFLTAALSDQVRRILLIDAPAVLGWQAWRDADAANSARLLGEVLAQVHDDGTLAVEPDAARAVLSGAMNEVVMWAATQGGPEHALAAGWAALEAALRGLRHCDPVRTGP